MSYHTLMRFRILHLLNGIRRKIRIGELHLFREVLENGTSIRILVPADKQQIDEKMNGLIGITDN